jgi:transposase
MTTIPLLPAGVKRFIRDAARSAGRAVEEGLQRITEQTLDLLLDLPEFKATHFEIESRGEEDILHLYCQHKHDFAICQRCREISASPHENKPRCVRDLDMGKWRVFIHFTGRRFYCEQCERSFTESLVSIDPRRRQTRRFERHVYERCLNSTRKAVAEGTWLDESTVKGIFKRWAKRAVKEQRRQMVQVLGIDEISLKKRHKQFALVISDLERRCVIAVLPGREKERLEKWLSDLTETERKAIRVVSIDMWNPYRSAVRAKLPHADIVADRFHVMKQLNDRLTQLRRAIQRKADEATKEILKGSRWLLVKNRNELTPEEEIRLMEILNVSAELRVAYLLKEEFRTIFEKINHPPQAELFLKAWIWKATGTGNRYLAKFVSTLRNWWTEILLYFGERFTNGFVEGTNRAIRVIINRAYGYRNFDNFRLQVLAQHGPAVPIPTISR